MSLSCCILEFVWRRSPALMVKLKLWDVLDRQATSTHWRGITVWLTASREPAYKGQYSSHLVLSWRPYKLCKAVPEHHIRPTKILLPSCTLVPLSHAISSSHTLFSGPLTAYPLTRWLNSDISFCVKRILSTQNVQDFDFGEGSDAVDFSTDQPTPVCPERILWHSFSHRSSHSHSHTSWGTNTTVRASTLTHQTPTLNTLSLALLKPRF